MKGGGAGLRPGPLKWGTGSLRDGVVKARVDHGLPKWKIRLRDSALESAGGLD